MRLPYLILLSILATSPASAELVVTCKTGPGVRHRDGTRPKKIPALPGTQVLELGDQPQLATWHRPGQLGRQLSVVSDGPKATTWSSPDDGGGWLTTRFKRSGRLVFVRTRSDLRATEIFHARCKLSSLPRTPTKRDVKNGIAGVMKAVRRCGGENRSGLVKIRVQVGASGRVLSATGLPPTDLSQCVEAAVLKARFAPSALGVTFTYPFRF
ncbi:MAG: hypothetical protein KJO07_15675 [Deltaproteobacteria bacterium]|nr:hypothetical protein [Deltaproteobacteria bacterium]